MGVNKMTGAEIYSIILTALIGIVGFFLKKAYSDIEKKADKAETQSLSEDVDKIRSTISKIKDDYLTRDDFFREQIKTERKLDKIMDILMELKGGSVSHE